MGSNGEDKRRTDRLHKSLGKCGISIVNQQDTLRITFELRVRGGRLNTGGSR
jgi:hypothetical protein